MYDNIIHWLGVLICNEGLPTRRGLCRGRKRSATPVQDERHDAHESDEAAGWLWSPFFNYKALFPHRHVLILPHSLSKQQAFPLEVIAVFRERHNGDETENKCWKRKDALAKEKMIDGHRSGDCIWLLRMTGNVQLCHDIVRRLQCHHCMHSIFEHFLTAMITSLRKLFKIFKY